MIVRVHGFDWHIYAEHIMPSLKQWINAEDASAVYQLFTQTRCAQEEEAVPAPLRDLLTWPRAQAFVKQLPRSSRIRREYELLCSAEAFTRVSDRYAHLHTPRLHQSAEALRTVWGALIEEYCLPWQRISIDEITALAGIAAPSETDDDLPEITAVGIMVGRLPTTLHLRGWLAKISICAMALFELLVCGRRSMPFGYLSGDPFGCYIGYLTPDEIRQLALILRDVQLPDRVQAEADYQQFLMQQAAGTQGGRMIDEVLPAYAGPFVKAVQLAERQGLGLLCSVG